MATKRKSKAKKARRGVKRAGSHAKARRRKPDARVVVELSPADRTISPYARRALGIFRKRVTEALQDFENRRIEVAVHAKNGMVRGVPRHENGSIIVDERRAVSTTTSRATPRR